MQNTKKVSGLVVGILVAVGLVVSSTVVLANSFSNSAKDELASGLGVTTEQLDSAITEVQEEKRAAYQAEKVDGLVADGTITEAQAVDLNSWIDTKPDVDIRKALQSYGKGFRLGSSTENIQAIIDSLNLDITVEEFTAEYKSAIETAKAAMEAMTPKERRLSAIEYALDSNNITSEEASELTSWINSMPDWLNDNTMYKAVLSSDSSEKGRGYKGNKRGGGKFSHGKAPSVESDDVVLEGESF